MATKRGEVAPAPTLSPRKTRSAARSLALGSAASPPPPTQPAAKKRKVAVSKSKAKAVAEDAAPADVDGDTAKSSRSSKGVIIEACKQCRSFKMTAMKVKEDLEKRISNIDVVINPEQPRKGYFEVRDANSNNIFVSLPNMKRPFKPMKELDLTDLVSNIVGKLH